MVLACVSARYTSGPSLPVLVLGSPRLSQARVLRVCGVEGVGRAFVADAQVRLAGVCRHVTGRLRVGAFIVPNQMCVC